MARLAACPTVLVCAAGVVITGGSFGPATALNATALSVTLALLGPEACIQVSVSVVVEAAA